jgi:hypothetical protein
MFHVSRIYTLVVHAYVMKVADEWLTRSLTHWSRVVLGKLRVPHLGDMCQAFYGAHVLLLHVQEYATRPYPEPDDLTSRTPILFL